MVEYVLAQGGGAPWIGPAVRAALFTAVGVVLIVVGVRRRLARSRWDREDDLRLLHSDVQAPSDEHRAPTPGPAGPGSSSPVRRWESSGSCTPSTSSRPSMCPA
jgi:hypothetical protein